MTPLQSNKAAPNKNNNKKKSFPHIKNFVNFSYCLVYFRQKYFVWKIYFKPHAYIQNNTKLYTKLNKPTKSKQYLKCKKFNKIK